MSRRRGDYVDNMKALSADFFQKNPLPRIKVATDTYVVDQKECPNVYNAIFVELQTNTSESTFLRYL